MRAVFGTEEGYPNSDHKGRPFRVHGWYVQRSPGPMYHEDSGVPLNTVAGPFRTQARAHAWIDRRFNGLHAPRLAPHLRSEDPRSFWQEAGPPQNRGGLLLGIMEWGSTSFHMEAIEVDQSGNAVVSGYGRQLDDLAPAFGFVSWNTVSIRDRRYVVFMHPSGVSEAQIAIRDRTGSAPLRPLRAP